MRNKPRSLFFLLLVILVTVFSTKFFAEEPPSISAASLTIEKRKSTSGHHYTLFHKNNCDIRLELKRPKKTDKTVLLCIPAAFTDLNTYNVDGACIANGKRRSSKINNKLGGAFMIADGQCTIFPTAKGKLLTDSLLDAVEKRQGSLFQQIQLVVNGQPEKFIDRNLFQRRAIVLMKDNRLAVVESEESITLEDFSKALVEFGTFNAIYTDMGAWDEGWYRDTISGSTITIGKMLEQTDKQCNWIVFKSK